MASGSAHEASPLSQLIPTASHVVPGAGSSTGGQAGGASASSASLVNPSSLALALPYSSHSVPIPLVDAQALQYLALEMPHTLRASAQRSARRRKRGLAMMREAGFDVDAADFDADDTVHGHSQQQQANGGEAVQVSGDPDIEVIARLEAIGSHVGATFAERLSRDRPPCATPLDVLKFICKDLWMAIWEKQVDNLRTNHRGVYVLQDNVFKPLLRLSVPAGPQAGQEIANMTRIQLAMPSGMIRGALARLGVASTVVAEATQIPQCTFHIKTTAAKS